MNRLLIGSVVLAVAVFAGCAKKEAPRPAATAAAPIFARSSGVMTGDGDSSTTF